MIEIINKVSGHKYDLNPNTKIKLRFSNPAFSNEIQTGGYSLPFSLPATQGNKKDLKYANLKHETSEPYQVIEVYLNIDTYFFYDAVMYVTNVNPDEFKADLALDLGKFVRALGDIRLNEEAFNIDEFTLDDDGLIEIAQREFLEIPAPPGDGDSYNVEAYLIVKNQLGVDYEIKYQSKISITEADLPDVVNRLAFLLNTNNLLGSIPNYPQLRGSGSGNIIVLQKTNPAQSLVATLRIRYQSTTTPATKTDHDFLLHVYNYTKLSTQRDYTSFVIGMMRNIEFYDDDKNIAYNGEINGYRVNETTGLSLLTPSPRKDIRYSYEGNAYAVVPFFRLSYIFDKIEEYTGYVIEGAWRDAPTNMCLYNNYALDLLNEFGLNTINRVVLPSEHCGEMKAADLMRELARNLGFYYTFSRTEKRCTLRYKQDILTSDIIDYTERAVSGFDSPRSEIKNTRLKYADSLEVDGYEDFFNEPITGAFSLTEDYTLNLGALPFQDETFDLLTRPVAIDAVKGSSDEYELGKNKVTPRVLVYQQAGPPTMGALTTDLLLTTYHEDWFKFMQLTKPYKKKIRMSLADLFSLNMNKRIAIDYETYLIKSVEIEISNEREGVNTLADFELMKQSNKVESFGAGFGDDFG